MFKYKDKVYVNKWFYKWQIWLLKSKHWKQYEISIWGEQISVNEDEIILYIDSEQYKKIQDHIIEEKERFDNLPLWKKLLSDYGDEYDHDFTLWWF